MPSANSKLRSAGPSLKAGAKEERSSPSPENREAPPGKGGEGQAQAPARVGFTALLFLTEAKE